MRKLTCHCEQVFNVDLPEVVNLDSDTSIIKQIADGSFLTCVVSDMRNRFAYRFDDAP